MSIMYNYLDKRAAAIAAIKDYDNMQFIIRNTDSEIVSERDKMVGAGSPNMDGMPHAHNPVAAEDRIVNGIDETRQIQEDSRRKRVEDQARLAEIKKEFNAKYHMPAKK